MSGDSMIETVVDEHNDLTIHKCIGEIGTEEYKKAILSFYKGSPTKNVVWDFSNTSLAETTTEGIKQLSLMVQKLGTARKNGKSAVVAPGDLEYGMARMFQLLTDNGQIPFMIRVFRSFDAAKQWLSSKP